MEVRNESSRLLEMCQGVQVVESKNQICSVMFVACSPMKWLIFRSLRQKALFQHFCKSKLDLTKASGSLLMPAALVSFAVVLRGRHCGLCTRGHGSRHRIRLPLYTQKPLSHCKLTKQKHFSLFLNNFLFSMCLYLKS